MYHNGFSDFSRGCDPILTKAVEKKSVLSIDAGLLLPSCCGDQFLIFLSFSSFPLQGIPEFAIL